VLLNFIDDPIINEPNTKTKTTIKKVVKKVIKKEPIITDGEAEDLFNLF
jgi:hypothetical protein